MKRFASTILCASLTLGAFTLASPALADDTSKTEGTTETSGETSSETSSAATSSAATSSAATTAQASESSGSGSSSGTKGRLGIGGLRALSGYRALHVKYFISPKWSISGAIGLDFYSPSNGDNLNVVNVLFAPGVNYWITPKNQSGPITAAFGLGGRMGIYLGGGPLSSSRSGINLEATTTAEVFLGKHFSLAPEAGLVFRFINNGPDPAGLNDGFGLSLGRNTGLFGGGSFNFYF